MYLVDHQIKDLGASVITENYLYTQVHTASYVLRLEFIEDGDEDVDAYWLERDESIVIECQETVRVPEQLMLQVFGLPDLTEEGLCVEPV